MMYCFQQNYLYRHNQFYFYMKIQTFLQTFWRLEFELKGFFALKVQILRILSSTNQIPRNLSKEMDTYIRES